MKNLLHRRLTVRQKEIDPFALYATLAQSRGETPCDAEHLRAFFLFQLRQVKRRVYSEQRADIKT